MANYSVIPIVKPIGKNGPWKVCIEIRDLTKKERSYQPYFLHKVFTNYQEAEQTRKDVTQKLNDFKNPLEEKTMTIKGLREELKLIDETII